MDFNEGQLFVVQGGFAPQRIIRLNLAGTGEVVENIAPMAVALSEFNHPGLGTIWGESLFYVANTGAGEDSGAIVMSTNLDTTFEIRAADSRRNAKSDKGKNAVSSSPGAPALPPVYLVDASIYIFRAWFSMSDEFVNGKGEPTNAVYGFLGVLCSLLEQTGTRHLAVAFDESLTTSYRNEIYPPVQGEPGSRTRRPETPVFLGASGSGGDGTAVFRRRPLRGGRRDRHTG